MGMKQQAGSASSLVPTRSPSAERPAGCKAVVTAGETAPIKPVPYSKFDQCMDALREINQGFDKISEDLRDARKIAGGIRMTPATRQLIGALLALLVLGVVIVGWAEWR